MSKLSKIQSMEMRRQTVLALGATHHHRAKCAEYLGISKQALGARIRKFKIKTKAYSWAHIVPHKPKGGHNKITLDIEVVLKEYRTGSTYTQLGAKFNCSASRIRVQLVEHLGAKYEAMKELNSDNRNKRKYHGNA